MQIAQQWDFYQLEELSSYSVYNEEEGFELMEKLET
jgi:hypothetical protein